MPKKKKKKVKKDEISTPVRDVKKEVGQPTFLQAMDKMIVKKAK